MPKPDRPVLPFTLHGQRQLLACALLALGFLLALALYLQWGRVRDLRAALAAPLPRTLVLPGNLLAVTPGERLCDLFLEGETLTLVTPEAPMPRPNASSSASATASP